MFWEYCKIAKAGLRYGFSIGQNSSVNGILIPLHGTIVVNETPK